VTKAVKGFKAAGRDELVKKHDFKTMGHHE
jgi:hypothetical protein